MLEKSNKSRAIGLLAAIVLAFVLQGCLLTRGIFTINYAAVFGVAGGAEKEVFKITPNAQAQCFPESTIAINGKLTQPSPRPTQLDLIMRHLDSADAQLSETTFSLKMKKSGSIPNQKFTFPATCVETGEELVFVAKPAGGNIDFLAKFTAKVQIKD
jgi:hypothetical protein